MGRGWFGRKSSPPSPYSYNPRRPLPRYIWKSRWPPLTVRRAIFRRSHEKKGDCEQSTEMAVFSLETDYSCETGYPFDDSRQIGKYVLIWKWSSFNFEWTIRLTLSFNFRKTGLSVPYSLCTAATSPQKKNRRRGVCREGSDCTQASLRRIIRF